jgi:hypothetical protein
MTPPATTPALKQYDFTQAMSTERPCREAGPLRFVVTRAESGHPWCSCRAMRRRSAVARRR